jgi:tetratricopeptide (TPR) repeat protein
MPSLKNLNIFADLFYKIGNEGDILAERGREPDILELPDREPESLSPDNGVPVDNVLPTGNDRDAVAAIGREPEATEKTPPDTGFDDLSLDDLLGGLSLDTETSPENAAVPDAGTKTLLPDDVSMVSDGGTVEDRVAESSADSAKPDFGNDGVMPDFDFGDFARPVDEDLSPLSIDNALPEELGATPAEADFSPDSFNLDEFDAPFEDAPTVPDLESIDDILEPLDSAEEAEPPSNGDVLGQDSGSLDAPTVSDQEEQIEDFADAPDTAVTDPLAAEAAPDTVDDSFDRFDLADSGEETPKKPDSSTEFPGLDDFIIPGIDVPAETVPEAAAQTGTQDAEKKDEEINLAEEEFAALQKTLQDYPLNLRIACEEAIINTAADPAQTAALVKLLVRGGSARDAAKLAGKITDKEIVVPRGYQKQTGAELEAEQATFAYIFVKKFLPTLELILFIAGVIVGTIYLGWTFVYKPWKADSIYKIGIERIAAGEYERANERFNEAWRWKPVKIWFSTYAEAFRDARQYFYAEEKYEQLIAYTASRNRRGVPEKKGALDYARMETDYLRDYEKADRIIRNHVLDWNPDDSDGLLALGDVNLTWGDANVEFSNEVDRNRDGGRYEIARENYARVLELYGWADPVLERMLLYFIRADDLGEVLPLQEYFMAQKKLTIRPATLSEMGAYLLDKQIEETRYVRDANIDRIEGVRDILLRAAEADPFLPDPHYQLARYYAMLGEQNREREYLDNASRLYDNVRQENAKLIRARIDTEQRIAHANRDRREFFSAEERLVKAANLYEDAVDRRIFRPTSRFGSIYADLGDLEYFTKFSDDSRAGNWQEAITYYLRAEQSGHSAPEMQYRLGSSYYHLSDFRRAEERFFDVSTRIPPNNRLLNALGNASFLRGNISAAESYFSKLVSTLEAERLRITEFRADSVPEHRDLIERLMIAQNNLGAVYQTLAELNGSNRYRTRALALYSDASRTWDYFARDPTTFVRPGLADLSTPTIGLPYLNTSNILYPASDTDAEIFINIDRDILDPSPWELLLSNN